MLQILLEERLVYVLITLHAMAEMKIYEICEV